MNLTLVRFFWCKKSIVAILLNRNMEKRHNTASQAICNFKFKDDSLLPPPGEHASEEYLCHLRTLCYDLIERINKELSKVQDRRTL